LDLRGREWREAGEDCIMRSFTKLNIIRVIKSKKMRLTVNFVCMGERRNAYKLFVRKSDSKRQLGRSGSRREDNITMDFREIGLKGVDWMHLVQDRNQ
jgi:hypothetical protein